MKLRLILIHLMDISLIERYLYHKDRVRELNETIEAWHETLDQMRETCRISKRSAEIDENCEDLIKQRDRHKKIADNLIKKIDKEEG